MLAVNCGVAGRVHITKHMGDGVGETCTINNTFIPEWLQDISGNEYASGAGFPDYIRYGNGVPGEVSGRTDLESPIAQVTGGNNAAGGPSTIVGDVRVAHRYVRAQINPRGSDWTLSELGLSGSTSASRLLSYVPVLKDGQPIQVLANEFVSLEYEYQFHYPVRVEQTVDVAGVPTLAELFSGGFTATQLVGRPGMAGTRLYSAHNRSGSFVGSNREPHGADETIANWPGGVACVSRQSWGNSYVCNFTPNIPKTDLDTLKVTIIWNFQNATYVPLD